MEKSSASSLTPSLAEVTPSGKGWHRMWLHISSPSYPMLAVVPLLHILSLKMLWVWKYFRIKHFYLSHSCCPPPHKPSSQMEEECLTGGWDPGVRQAETVTVSCFYTLLTLGTGVWDILWVIMASCLTLLFSDEWEPQVSGHEQKPIFFPGLSETRPDAVA